MALLIAVELPRAVRDIPALSCPSVPSQKAWAELREWDRIASSHASSVEDRVLAGVIRRHYGSRAMPNAFSQEEAKTEPGNARALLAIHGLAQFARQYLISTQNNGRTLNHILDPYAARPEEHALGILILKQTFLDRFDLTPDALVAEKWYRLADKQSYVGTICPATVSDIRAHELLGQPGGDSLLQPSLGDTEDPAYIAPDYVRVMPYVSLVAYLADS